MIQTNLREIDMIDIRADQVVRDLADFQATVLMINTAGIIASYPTHHPLHYPSRFLHGDSLEAIISACHDAGIRVIARTDFSKVRRPLFEKHPEWAYRTQGGEVVDYNGDVHVCINGAYQQEVALEIIKELITTLQVDGIFINMGGYRTRDYSGNEYGICHCESCLREFRKAFGSDLPSSTDIEDPVFRKHGIFRRETVRAHREKVGRLIERLRPDMCIDSYFESGRGFIRREANTALDRALPRWQYHASENTRWVVGTYPGMISSNSTVDFIDFPTRHVAVSPHLQKLRLVQCLANGGALDYYLIGRIDNHEDRSGFESVREIFHYHAANEFAYRDLVPRATIALLKDGMCDSDEYRGWFRLLVEEHHLFDVILADAVGERDLSRYSCIVLPDTQCLGDGLARAIDRFVEQGGCLVATGRSGFRDGDFEPRPVPALGCRGMAEAPEIVPSIRGAYFRLDGEEGFPRCRDTRLLFADDLYVNGVYEEGSVRRLRMIPPQRFGPPERCYADVEGFDPGFLTRPYGKGRCIYLPWLPGKLYHRQGYPNTGLFMGDLLEREANLEPVGGEIPPMVEVTVLDKRDGSGSLIHLVNHSGHFGVSFHAPLPIHGITLRIPWPEAPTLVRSLRSDEKIPFAWEDGRLILTVTELGDFEALSLS